MQTANPCRQLTLGARRQPLHQRRESTAIALLGVVAATLASIQFAYAQAPSATMPAELTPVGAEKAGSKDGVIPAWTGGMLTAPANWKPGQGRARPDPFASDKPVMTIDAASADAHVDKLSAGEYQLLKTIKGYRVDVYPTRRSCGFSDAYYERTKANIGYAKVDANGYLLTRAKAASIPFPMPKNGVEAMWNFKLRPLGEGIAWTYFTVIPPASGNGIGDPQVTDEIDMFPMGNPRNEDTQGARNIELRLRSTLVAPPQFSGDTALAESNMAKGQDIWLYFASQRRVRRAPTYQYDAPVVNFENLVTVDAYAMFNGLLDRYDYKLVGKKDLVVPYNWTRLNGNVANAADAVSPRFINREYARYELHRVWTVEAALKPGLRHTFPKRVFYIDEDSWNIVLEDLYDSQGKVQRVMESGTYPVSEIQGCASMAFASYDLPTGRVVVDHLPAAPKGIDWLAAREGRVKDSMFEPDDLRRSAR